MKQPINYKDMDKFLASIGNSWQKILTNGIHNNDNYTGVINYLRRKYPKQMMCWKDVALRYYFESRGFVSVKSEEKE